MKIIISIALLLVNTSVFSQICVGEAGKVKWECWQNLFDNELGEIYVEEYFPARPDFVDTIFRLQSPINFDNLMGGKISGFISVPVTDDVTFNLTGDDYTRFYLSSNQDPGNMTLRAYADEYSSIEEHNKFPSQTSSLITLTAGQYYYFELIYLEGSGGDHISLYWKTVNDDPVNWRIVNSSFISDVGCLPALCPSRGTPCDDGNGTTTNDMEDGHCNCVGQADTDNECIGERGYINNYGFDSIPGNYLNDLYSGANFPAMPNRGKRLHQLAIPWSDEVDSTGHLIQSFLTVPVTGNYKFNITGNNECIFFLSSDETIENKQSHQILVSGSTDPTEHNKYLWQSTSNIYLEKNKYYYIELNHKEGSYSEHFSVFWQTPFTEPGVWKRISDFYCYKYECEMACIPEGTPCDDGDPFTNNDQYDMFCDCVGTPCSGDNCTDPLASYSYYPKCDLTDQIDNREDNNWLSCTVSANPNSARSDSHWVLYDFGQDFIMNASHVWNYNTPSGFQQGFEQVAVDYSLDGINWIELNIYNWPLANGSSDYSGFIGPNFNGTIARFVLITSLDVGEPCRGFGKLLINAELCGNSGEVCDDGNPLTINDMINDYCVCTGTSTAFNECLVDTLSLGDTLIVAGVHSAINLVESENTIGNGFVVFISGEEIDLMPGFEAIIGSNFEAFIEQCNSKGKNDKNDEIRKSKKPVDILKVLPIPESDIQIIEFFVENPGQVHLQIADQNGEIIFDLLNVEFKNSGIYQKRIRTKKLNKGIYNVVFGCDQIVELERLSVL